jgi:hypothetical protein
MKYIELKCDEEDTFDSIGITPDNLTNSQISELLKELGFVSKDCTVGWYDHPNASDSPVYFFSDKGISGWYVRLVPARIFRSCGRSECSPVYESAN